MRAPTKALVPSQLARGADAYSERIGTGTTPAVFTL
jgi:hypothetical protein